MTEFELAFDSAITTVNANDGNLSVLAWQTRTFCERFRIDDPDMRYMVMWGLANCEVPSYV